MALSLPIAFALLCCALLCSCSIIAERLASPYLARRANFFFGNRKGFAYDGSVLVKQIKSSKVSPMTAH